MKLRSALMAALKSHIVHTKMSQPQAAQLFGLRSHAFQILMRRKVNLFGLDALVNMARADRLHVDMRIRRTA